MKTAGIILILFSGTGLGLCKKHGTDSQTENSGKKHGAASSVTERGNPLHRGDVGRCLSLMLQAKMPGEYRHFSQRNCRMASAAAWNYL